MNLTQQNPFQQKLQEILNENGENWEELSTRQKEHRNKKTVYSLILDVLEQNGYYSKKEGFTTQTLNPLQTNQVMSDLVDVIINQESYEAFYTDNREWQFRWLRGVLNKPGIYNLKKGVLQNLGLITQYNQPENFQKFYSEYMSLFISSRA